MSNEKPQIIIIKKSGRKKKEHHGGSWKIAYADFVTAMMAFFMLLWLLSLLNKYQLQGISAYFQKPLKDIFVGSKNAEQYKNQTDSKTIQIKKDIGGAANSEINDEKSTKPAVKAESKSEKDVDKKKEDNPSKSTKESKVDKKGPDKEMEKLKRKLEISLQNNSKVQAAMRDNLSFSVQKDGVKVSLHDSTKNQMFSLGKPDFRNYAKPIIAWLGSEFNKVPKKIIIVGHTDSYQYEPNSKYSNWELSTDRANTVRHLLIMEGMDPDKIIRVEGAADVSLLDKEGNNPANRRVEIIVLTDEAAKRYMDQ